MEPKIRFKGFEGEWKASIIGDFCSVSIGEFVIKTKQNDNAPYPVYNGGSSYTGFYENYNQEGPKVIVSARGANAGFVNYCKKNFWAGNSCYSIATKDNRNLKFLYHCLKKNQSTYLNNQQAANIPSISKKDIQETILMMPKSFEQKAIASYFTSIDSQISAATSRLASLKQMKAASLQAMFPQEGETVPKIRFKGFEGEWKKVSFKDFTFHAGTKNRDNLPLESYSISNEFGFIPQNEQFENGGTMTQADKRMYYIVSPNSFAYNPARINVGSLGYYEGKEDVIVSSLYEVFKTDDTICDKFLLYWFKTDIFQKMIEQFQEGGVRLYFFYDKMCKCSLMRPSLAEQQAIASYFTSLDRQISLQSQRLEKLKQIKSACLDKMFV